MRDILLLTSDFPPKKGGVARYLQILTEYFSDRVTIVTNVPGAKEVTEAAIVLPLEYSHVWPRWLKSVWHLITRRESYRLVLVSHVLPFGTAAMVASFVTRKPYIVFVHGMDVRLAQKKSPALLKRVLRSAHTVITNSYALKQEIFALDKKIRTECIYPPLSPKFSQVKIQSPQQDQVQLLSVSRLVKRKGHERVLRALQRMAEDATLPPWRYVIVGDGEELTRLESLVHEFHLQERVEFRGMLTDEALDRTYAESDLFILPILEDSVDKEGFGMVFVEAAAYYLPSITTNISGVNEAVLDQKTGVVVNNGDEEALEKAILFVKL